MEIGSQVRIKDAGKVGTVTKIRGDGWYEVEVAANGSSSRMARTRPQTYAVRATGLRSL